MDINCEDLILDEDAVIVFLDEIMPKLLESAIEFFKEDETIVKRFTNGMLRNLMLLFYLLGIHQEKFSMKQNITFGKITVTIEDVLPLLPFYVSSNDGSSECTIVNSGYIFDLTQNHYGMSDFRFRYLGGHRSAFTDSTISGADLLELMTAGTLMELSGKTTTWGNALPIVDTKVAEEKTVLLHHMAIPQFTGVQKTPIELTQDAVSEALTAPPDQLASILQMLPEHLLLYPRSKAASSDLYVTLSQHILCFQCKSGAQKVTVKVLRDEIEKCGAMCEDQKGKKSYILCMIASHLGATLTKFLDESGRLVLGKGTYIIIGSIIVHIVEEVPAGLLLPGGNYRKLTECAPKAKRQKIKLNEVYYIVDGRKSGDDIPKNDISTIESKKIFSICENLEVVLLGQDQMIKLIGKTNWNDLEKVSNNQYKNKLDVLTRIVYNTYSMLPTTEQEDDQTMLYDQTGRRGTKRERDGEIDGEIDGESITSMNIFNLTSKISKIEEELISRQFQGYSGQVSSSCNYTLFTQFLHFFLTCRSKKTYNFC
jgi:hypothetical protein